MKFDDITQWVIAYRESPTWPKLSQQVSSEIRGQARQRESEAGFSKAAGCVIEPRNRAHGGLRIASGRPGVKADVVWIAEGSSSECVMASNQDTTGVCEQGM
jgi:hypothetical protein